MDVSDNTQTTTMICKSKMPHSTWAKLGNLTSAAVSTLQHQLWSKFKVGFSCTRQLSCKYFIFLQHMKIDKINEQETNKKRNVLDPRV
jgi:hypothetical protein